MASVPGWPSVNAGNPLGLAFAVLLFVVHLLVAARAITRRNRTPASRVAWVAVVMTLPLLGVVAYLLLGETSIGRERMRRLRGAEASLAAAVAAHRTLSITRPIPPSITPSSLPVQPSPSPPPPRTPPDEPPDLAAPATAAALFNLASSISGFEAQPGNRIELLGDAGAPPEQPMRDSDAAIDALVADIDAAREHVHLGFYIWLDDGNGGRVVDAVCAAARRGVHCRVMVDALGSRAFVRGARWQQLREAGAHALATLNDIPRLGRFALGRLDLRNHRKIAVIDNRVAYCGSQNCADPQFRVAARFAPWVDLLLRCEGPVVRQAQALFLGNWIAETGEAALAGLPVAAPPPCVEPGGAWAQMFGTGPAGHANAMSDMFVAVIYAARDELLVTTPYFVPDSALLRALCAAPRRGVATTLIVPARNNSRLVAAACRSCYADLLDAGVAIHEYPLGLLHTKSITVDGRLALVGSANMDRRSLQLNFENNLLVADRAVTAAIRRRQLGYLSVSPAVARDAVRAWSWRTRLVQNAIAMMAPVL